MWENSCRFIAPDFPLDPLETSTLNMTPFVQNKIDDCLSPLVSSRIYQGKWTSQL